MNKRKKGRAQRTCEYCGREFTVKPASKTVKYCSFECRCNNRSGPKIKMKCIICGKEYKVNPSVAKSRKMCSIKCKSIAFGKYQSGKNSSKWLGGKSFEPYCLEFNNYLKERIRERDNYACQLCNITAIKVKRKLHIHHIDYDKKNNRPENLISLCGKCHAKTGVHRAAWEWFFNLPIGEEFGNKFNNRRF